MIFCGILILVGIFLKPIFNFTYPLLLRNKWERKFAKILCKSEKKPINQIMKEFDAVRKEREKEEKIRLRKEKIDKLNNL